MTAANQYRCALARLRENLWRYVALFYYIILYIYNIFTYTRRRWRRGHIVEIYWVITGTYFSPSYGVAHISYYLYIWLIQKFSHVPDIPKWASDQTRARACTRSRARIKKNRVGETKDGSGGAVAVVVEKNAVRNIWFRPPASYIIYIYLLWCVCAREKDIYIYILYSDCVWESCCEWNELTR